MLFHLLLDMTYHLQHHQNNIYKFFDIKPVGGNWSIDESLVFWLRSNLPDGSTILEFGSGPATNVLAETYKMISVENNLAFANQYKTECIVAPLVDGWYDLSILEKSVFNRTDYDCILVDGPARTEGSRAKFMEHLHRFNQSAILIIDDIYDQDSLYKSLLEKRKDISYVHEGNKWAAIWPDSCPVSQIVWPKRN